MTRFISTAILAGLGLMSAACGGSVTAGGTVELAPTERSALKTSTGQVVHKEAAKGFEDALKAFVAHDTAFDWKESVCRDVAGMFQKSSDAQQSATSRGFAAALYNSALALQRCELHADAEKTFQEAIKAEAGFHRAQAQLAMYEFSRNANLDAAITRLNDVIKAAKYQNVEALVGVAALQMERQNDQADSDGKNDLERAVKNIQRALAIDDTYMPAFNQLAIYYLERAKAKVGRKSRKKAGLDVSGVSGKSADKQVLDLATLVTAQGIQKNPKYASIYNTAGLIQVEERNYNGAVKSFKRARDLDPLFFEAHMNYAATNLSFRGFKEAEAAYRDALRLKPKEYEAHLGLALALRGQIDPTNFDKYVAEAQKELDECKKLAPERPETYYNEAILTQEYRAKGESTGAVPMLKKAAEIYRTFASKAGGNEVFAVAVKRAKERETDINDTVKFIEEGEIARKAEEEAAKAAAANPPPPPPPADGAAAPPPAK